VGTGSPLLRRVLRPAGPGDALTLALTSKPNPLPMLLGALRLSLGSLSGVREESCCASACTSHCTAKANQCSAVPGGAGAGGSHGACCAVSRRGDGENPAAAWAANEAEGISFARRCASFGTQADAAPHAAVPLRQVPALTAIEVQNHELQGVPAAPLRATAGLRAGLHASAPSAFRFPAARGWHCLQEAGQPSAACRLALRRRLPAPTGWRRSWRPQSGATRSSLQLGRSSSSCMEVRRVERGPGVPLLLPCGRHSQCNMRALSTVLEISHSATSSLSDCPRS